VHAASAFLFGILPYERLVSVTTYETAVTLWRIDLLCLFRDLSTSCNLLGNEPPGNFLCPLVDRHLTSMEVGWSMNHFTYRLTIKRLVKMAASHKWNFSPLDP
jgi:hypothetical protein